jgi:BirA family biotin operon repressor/biotin-[acetyl-CoA-carboxylase] ligase
MITHADTAREVANGALDIEAIRRQLWPDGVGHRLCLYVEVPSTNATLRDLARAGAPDGTVVLAESQTAGRGRAGQTWFSPPGVNLYASVLLRPAIPPRAVPVFSFVTSLALADTVDEQGLRAAIKWPNDILVKGKKVAGVLTEVAAAGDHVEFVILGVGVNLNVTRQALHAALGPAGRAAGSLQELVGRPIDRNAFAATFLNYLGQWLGIYREQGAAPILRAWRDRDILTGARVEVREEAATFDGRVRGVGLDGCLEVEDVQGRIHGVVAGEIRLIE